MAEPCKGIINVDVRGEPYIDLVRQAAVMLLRE